MTYIKLLTNRRKRFIWNSLKGAFAGWVTSMLLVVVALLCFAAYEAAFGKGATNVESPWVEAIVIFFGILFVSAFPLMIAFPFSGFVAIAGWLLLGLPLALIINDKIADSLVCMVALHLTMTIAFAGLTLKSWPWGNGLEGGAWFSYWGMVIGATGGAAFWYFNRNDRLAVARR